MSLASIRTHAESILEDVRVLEEPPPPPPPPEPRWHVGPGDNLLDTLDQAPAGATVTVDPVFQADIGTVTISKPVRVQCALPLPPGRISPDYALPTLRAAAFTFAAPDVQFAGLKVYGQGNTLVTTGERSLLDRVVLLGRGTLPQHRGISANSPDVTIHGAHIADIWKDIDTQAVWCYAWTRNLRVLNSFLQASGENFMAGGADGPSADSVPDGILLEDCELDKPIAWKNRGDVGVKNFFEIKNARNVVARRVVANNCWQDAQQGMCIVVSPLTQNGRAPWSCAENILLEDWTVSQVGGGIAIMGLDYRYPAQVATNLTFRRMTFDNISRAHAESTVGAHGRLFHIMRGPRGVTFEDIHSVNPGIINAIAMFDGASAVPPLYAEDIAFRRCRVHEGSYGIIGDAPGQQIGEPQLRGCAPNCIWEDMTVYRRANQDRTFIRYPAGTTMQIV